MGLKDFQIISKLGEGAFSSVWKVKRISDGQEYAMKKVKMMALSEKERQNALNEVRILASIKNPYIIGYKEAFFDDTASTLCIVMEHAGGGDLYNKIEKHQKARTSFKEQDLWNFAIQMILGLKTLHDMKILHRDLKSANIFLSTDGKTVKLGDLNVSKVAKSELVYTQTGTPYYASPEVWKDKPYDSKSDIWSLGCVLYELCSLKPPFRANDMQGLYRKIQKGVYDRIPSQYSSDLSELIALCLQVNPAQRPNCDKLLNHPLILRNGKEFMNNMEDIEDANELLGTIKLPRNIRAIGSQLPKANYKEEIKSVEFEKGALIKIEENERPLYSRRGQRAYSHHVPGLAPQDKIIVPKPASRQYYVPSRPALENNENLVERVKPVRIRVEQLERPSKPMPLVQRSPPKISVVKENQRHGSNIMDENADPNLRERKKNIAEVKRQPNPAVIVNRNANLIQPENRYSNARAIDMISNNRDDAISKRAENIVRRYYAEAALAEKREPLAEIKKGNNGTPVNMAAKDAIEILEKYNMLPNIREPHQRKPSALINRGRYDNLVTGDGNERHYVNNVENRGVNVVRQQQLQGRGIVRPSWWG